MAVAERVGRALAEVVVLTVGRDVTEVDTVALTVALVDEVGAELIVAEDELDTLLDDEALAVAVAVTLEEDVALAVAVAVALEEDVDVELLVDVDELVGVVLELLVDVDVELLVDVDELVGVENCVPKTYKNL